MLTDKDLVVELCLRNKIIMVPTPPYEDAYESFTLEDTGNKVVGYSGFFIDISFLRSGALHSIGAWE